MTGPAAPAVGRRATLASIASEASVSISTVSKVLNGRNGVSDVTRAQVERLLVSHGYSRRGSAQAHAPLIELVFHAIDSVWAIEIIIGVERVAKQHGMSVILTETGDRHSPGPDWIGGVLRRRPSGVILIIAGLSHAHMHQLRTRGIPFVIVDPAGDPLPDVPAIGAANWSGGYLAGRHLLELGHRDAAIVTGPQDVLSATARLSGFRAALEAAGIELPPEYVAPGDYGYEDGVVGGTALLALPNPPTAIFASSDLQALGVYEAARTAGVTVPDDLSVVGYDDLRVSQWAGPPLTTVRQPLTEMAEEATRMVIRLRDGQTEHQRLDLATRLVLRSSTAAPRR